MLLFAMLLAATPVGHFPDQTKVVLAQTSTPQACFVFGEVFSTNQTSAMLSSNCRIKIDRQDHEIVLTGPHAIVRIPIPADLTGIHEFVYRWGSDYARFDDDKVRILSRSVAPVASEP